MLYIVKSTFLIINVMHYQSQAGGGGGGIGQGFDQSLWPGGRAFELTCCPGGRDI